MCWVATTTCVTLMVTAWSNILLIPTASSILSNASAGTIAMQSRGSSIMLILLYCGWLVFQLKTHKKLFEPEGVQYAHQRDQEQRPKKGALWLLVVSFAVTSAIIGVHTTFAVDNIDAVIESTSIPKSFIGFVMLPILNNDLTAISYAILNNMDFAVHSSIGRSLQITLLFTEGLVLIAWPLGIVDMNLLFDTYQVFVLFLSTLTVSYMAGTGGRTNWYKGAVLVTTYVIVALGSWTPEIA
ncbi:hypothetical protein N656DRAFT_260882 [Canariomyces notabilis]|uniref:Sodium/calcium exchanger membrane region domain-containing protein n=1 Tax=Canariomyces notabilis TaxID=2074819 RepID=A0AAN6YWG4_9PEZI|nr:hypothetical protein N656DRAFT_260882 [Canariomyces arenarius]